MRLGCGSTAGRVTRRIAAASSPRTSQIVWNANALCVVESVIHSHTSRRSRTLRLSWITRIASNRTACINLRSGPSVAIMDPSSWT
jgi:hypothetical protein